jgi:hypothetical protein
MPDDDLIMSMLYMLDQGLTMAAAPRWLSWVRAMKLDICCVLPLFNPHAPATSTLNMTPVTTRRGDGLILVKYHYRKGNHDESS